MQHVCVHAVALGALGDRDAVGFRKGVQGSTAHEIPFPPGGDDLDCGIKSLGRKFEAHLIVALACGTVGYGIGTFLVGDVNEGFGDKGTGNGGAEQILVLVDAGSAHHGEDKVPGHFLAQVKHVGLDCTGFQGLFLDARKILGLAKVGCHCDNLALVGIDEPFENDRGVETAAVGKNNFFDVCHWTLLARLLAASPIGPGPTCRKS